MKNGLWTLTRTATVWRSNSCISAIRQPTPIADRRFEIECLDAGVVTFPFTLGSRLARTGRNGVLSNPEDPRYGLS